jgi:DNA-directed RNA polymerase specialized sigma24 family protein
VADRLGISATAAKVRSHRALTRLRLVLEETDA